MPEAPVEVHGDLRLGEDNVGTPTGARNDLTVHTEAEAAAMEQLTQGDLPRCIAAPCGDHPAKRVGRRSRRDSRSPWPSCAESIKDLRAQCRHE